MKHRNTISGIILVIAIVAMIAQLQIKQGNEKKYREYLAIQGVYTIGTYSYQPINAASHIPDGVVFFITIDKKKYSICDFDHGLNKQVSNNDFVSTTDLKRGDQFLVLYEKDKPEKATIRLNCPIKDSADFKRYIKIFEEMRQQKK